MKICHITSVHNYQDIRINIKECRSLVKNGFEVHLIAPNVESKKENNINIHGVSNNFKGRINRIIKFTQRILEKAIEVDANVYHFHDPELIPVGKRLKKMGYKVIYDIHEDVPRAILSKYWIPRYLRTIVSYIFEKYENISVKKFDYAIGATPFITSRFRKINRNSININNYPLLKELRQDNASSFNKLNQVCYVGGLTKIRGIENIIQASKDIKGNVILAGPITDDLSEVIKSSEIDYRGILNRNGVSTLLNESVAGLVLFLPEPNHINAQPNKMFEYMSAGLPVIASNFPLWKEIIEGNNCGICVDPLNVEEIAEAIQWVVDNPIEAQKMGENGRRAVEEKYNWERESEKLIQLYNDLEKEIK